jgi:hypothetical protein
MPPPSTQSYHAQQNDYKDFYINQLGFQEWGNADFDEYLMAKNRH